MKILSAQQTRETDAYTIAHEPITSIGLMERASKAFVTWFINNYTNKKPILIVAGAGNNGGDALAIARLLHQKSYLVNVFLALPKTKGSPNYQTNLNRLPTELKIVNEITSTSEVIIDGLFGSGLTRKVEGELAQIIEKTNKLGKNIISIDIASGLSCDGLALGKSIIKPTHTISFQLPKLAFMLADNASYVGQWSVVNIGLNQNFITKQTSNYFYQKKLEISQLIKARDKFSYKGTFGHALLVGGSHGKIGAIVLASKSCLRTGAGIVTSLLPNCGYAIMQTAIPEVMCLTSGEKQLELIKIDNVTQYSAIGIGPGLGQSKGALSVLIELLKTYSKPMVLDADALNLLAKNPELIELLPKQSILTPHVGEFNRLVGEQTNSLSRLKMQQEFSKKYNLIIVLKGANTSISTTDGTVYFNSTGNPGMATAGSGDVLTGIITSFLAQGYSPLHSAQIGVFIHGLAGDFAKLDLGESSIIASDITERISKAFISLH